MLNIYLTVWSLLKRKPASVLTGAGFVRIECLFKETMSKEFGNASEIICFLPLS